MSYVSRRMKSSLGPRGRGLSGVVDDLIYDLLGTTPSMESDAACLGAANAQSAALLAKASDVSKNWQPTGLYQRDQVQSLVQWTLGMLSSASSLIDQTTSEPTAPGARDALRLKTDAIQRKMSDAQVFTGAVGQAMQKSVPVIDAPGLKTWIVNSMITAADGVTAAYYVACQRPWWVGALKVFMAAFDKVWGATKQILGVAADLGMAVLKIPDTVGQIWTMAKWGSIALLGWWAYENVPKHLKGA
jgi:hypothetical protein